MIINPQEVRVLPMPQPEIQPEAQLEAQPVERNQDKSFKLKFLLVVSLLLLIMLYLYRLTGERISVLLCADNSLLVEGGVLGEARFNQRTNFTLDCDEDRYNGTGDLFSLLSDAVDAKQ
jgi:hypothetical protein